MSTDEQSIAEHIIMQYRQDADVLKYNLARANAQIAARDRIIADQQALLDLFPTDDAEPTGESAEVPKPGPPKPAPPKPRSSVRP